MATAVVPHPLRLAMEARDHAAFVAALAPDVVLHSPATAIPFRGREAVAALMRPVDERHVLAIRARIGGRDVELMEELRHDAGGQVSELRLHGRRLAGVAPSRASRVRRSPGRAGGATSWPSGS